MEAQAFVEGQRELAKRKKPIQVKHSSLSLLMSQDGAVAGGSSVAKGRQQKKSCKMVESEEEDGNTSSSSGSNNDNDMPLAWKWAVTPSSVASTKQQKIVASERGREEQEDVEMREKTPLATVAEVEPAASRGEVEGEQEVEEEAIEVEKDEESNEEIVVQWQETWTSTLL
ncbi:hypothetical protein C0989_000615 [Termitomyces sp. Mn162]|nr:hypothetical protein C0989_000615 [Termitomyces sp. Mn162]